MPLQMLGSRMYVDGYPILFVSCMFTPFQVKKRVSKWKEHKDNEQKSHLQLEWEAQVVEYTAYLYKKTSVHGNASAGTTAPLLSKGIPLLGPRFIPPGFLHALKRGDIKDIKPSTAYLKPFTVVHPVYFPSILEVCPQCQTNDVRWDGWNTTGGREIHGIRKEERAIGYQLRCNVCEQKFGKGGAEHTKNGPGYCFSTTSQTFWAKWEFWKIPCE